ncbi:SMP-30/gluconolactonase/LRE family protein [Paenibacillus sepulcri]|uniref:SMP-30/gluconolactonase/LRE family protein n=1 Tax=Paenibacillus sepulcri TaxID=359917 RepID=A0ABS7CDC7_9BACL|nr:SMP-30/gluconolactonase/LRE family protein [Paenibacillus sepulcri]
MKIIRYNTLLDELIPEGREIHKLASGYSFAEGPVWCSRTNQLYFTDFPNHHIHTWSEADGARLYKEQSGRAIGLALDAEGRLLQCESLARRISRIEADGAVAALATHYQGKRLNNTNDVIVKKDGTIYFSDPYSAMLGDSRDLDYNGVFRYRPATGAVDLLVGDFERPNGLAFSPDESLLYINDTNKQHIKVYDTAPDGTVNPEGRIFAEMDAAMGPGAADGMKTDERGNVYVTGPGGIWIYAPSGEHLGRIELPEVAANLCFGSGAGSQRNDILYITASTSLYSVRLDVCGAM